MNGWRVARGVVLAGFAGIALALPFLSGDWTLRFWRGVVPLLPVLFLVAPGAWRNVCPLATLGQGPSVERAARPRDRGSRIPVGRLAVALTLLIVLRPAVFEQSGGATSVLLAGVGIVAVGVGRRSPRKSGFCNRLCPILPVQHLYGQAPLLEVGNDRCGPCDVCTAHGCVDLAGPATMPQLLGPGRRSTGFLWSGWGAFAAALPGIVVGFSIAGPGAGAGSVAGAVLLGAAISSLAVGAVVRGLGVEWRIALPVLAALAAALHLWLAIPGLFEVWSIPASPLPARIVAIAGVGIWGLHALRLRRGRLVELRPTRG